MKEKTPKTTSLAKLFISVNHSGTSNQKEFNTLQLTIKKGFESKTLNGQKNEDFSTSTDKSNLKVKKLFVIKLLCIFFYSRGCCYKSFFMHLLYVNIF